MTISKSALFDRRLESKRFVSALREYGLNMLFSDVVVIDGVQGSDSMSCVIARITGVRYPNRNSQVRVLDPEFDAESPEDYKAIYDEVLAGQSFATFKDRSGEALLVRQHGDAVSIQWFGTGMVVIFAAA